MRKTPGFEGEVISAVVHGRPDYYRITVRHENGAEVGFNRALEPQEHEELRSRRFRRLLAMTYDEVQAEAARTAPDAAGSPFRSWANQVRMAQAIAEASFDR